MSDTPRTDAIPQLGAFNHWRLEDVFALCRTLERELADEKRDSAAARIAAQAIEPLMRSHAELREPAAELLYLYDWRPKLAQMEESAKDENGGNADDRKEVKRLLREYGERKKAGWIALRAALASQGNTDPLRVGDELDEMADAINREHDAQGNTEPGKPFHTEANARRLLAFRDLHATDDHAGAWDAIYWLVSENAADIYNPWAEIEGLVPEYKPGDFIVPKPCTTERGGEYDTELEQRWPNAVTPPPSDWIPVSERLPNEQTYCLAVERQHFHPFIPTIAYHTTKGGRHMLATAWIDSTGDYIDVTHWMPLPSAPSAENQTGSGQK